MTTNEVIETLKEYSEYCSFKGTYPWNDRIELSMAMAIEALKERKTGKWIVTNNKDEIYGFLCACSICGNTIVGAYNYCPDCGAKMEVGE